MQKQKNTFIASCITLVILSAMTGSINALQLKEKAVKSVVKKSPEAVSAKQITTAKTPNSDPTTVAPAVQNMPSSQPVAPTTSITTPRVGSTPPLSQPPTVVPTPAPIPAPAPSPTYIYKNGTYPVTVTYNVPGTMASLNVSLSIVNDTINASSVTDPPSTDPTSKNWDNRFINDYQQYVIGRALSTLHLSNTSGSSLTTTGFNNALNQIRSAAHN